MLDSPVFHDDKVVAFGEVVHLVGHQQHCLPFQDSAEDIVVHSSCHLRVYCGDRVVKEVDIGFGVDSPSKGESGLLSTGHRDASLPDLRPVATRKQFEIVLQAADLDDLFVELLVEGLAEGDVLLDSPAEDVGLLLNVRNRPGNRKLAAVVGSFLENSR